MDISAATELNFSKFGMCGLKTHMEGSMSQKFYLDPRFCFMQSREKSVKKYPKVTLFFIHKMRARI